MSASGQLSGVLAPLRRGGVRLLVPLFVDTFPLGHFYASGERMSAEATELVKVFDWNDELGLISLLGEAIRQKTPLGVYLSRDMARKLTEHVRHSPKLNEFYDAREIPVSTLRIRRFFALLDPPREPVSVDEWIKRCRGIDKIMIHSDTNNLAEAGRRFFADRIKGLCGSWPSRPELISKRSNFSLSAFCSPRSAKMRHVYWFSEVGQAALRKTTRSFIEFSVPDETHHAWDEFQLVLLLFLPASMITAEQSEMISSLALFHEQLFSFDESSLNEIFEPVWKVFMLLFVTMQWPVFNLFETVEEYTRCFLDHHTFIGRQAS